MKLHCINRSGRRKLDWHEKNKCENAWYGFISKETFNWLARTLLRKIPWNTTE